MRFCEYMQKMLELRGYTSGQLEYKTGISSSTIYQHLHGTQFPNKKNFIKYLKAFDSPYCYDLKTIYNRFKEEEINYKKGV